MKVLAVTDFCLGSSNAEPYTPGDILDLSAELAHGLINEGLVIDFAGYEEKAAILQYDGKYSRDLADALAWCHMVCMLTDGMSQLCERVRPCPRRYPDRRSSGPEQLHSYDVTCVTAQEVNGRGKGEW